MGDGCRPVGRCSSSAMSAMRDGLQSMSGRLTSNLGQALVLHASVIPSLLPSWFNPAAPTTTSPRRLVTVLLPPSERPLGDGRHAILCWGPVALLSRSFVCCWAVDPLLYWHAPPEGGHWTQSFFFFYITLFKVDMGDGGRCVCRHITGKFCMRLAGMRMVSCPWLAHGYW